MWFDDLPHMAKYFNQKEKAINSAFNPLIKLIKYYQWRVQTLLEANNRTLERARKAEAELKSLKEYVDM
jgi:hypothetical protein